MKIMSDEKRAVNSEAKIVNFTDLNAWQSAHKLYLSVYEATKAFPKEELFGITSQLRRAALSISSNIAEGFGRNSKPDRTHFYVMARGSLFEVQNQLLAARDTALLSGEDFKNIYLESQITQRILIGLINATRERK